MSETNFSFDDLTPCLETTKPIINSKTYYAELSVLYYNCKLKVLKQNCKVYFVDVWVNEIVILHKNIRKTTSTRKTIVGGGKRGFNFLEDDRNVVLESGTHLVNRYIFCTAFCPEVTESTEPQL